VNRWRPRSVSWYAARWMHVYLSRGCSGQVEMNQSPLPELADEEPCTWVDNATCRFIVVTDIIGV